MNVNNVRIKSFGAIASPAVVLGDIPLTEEAEATVVKGRKDIEAVLSGEDSRKIVIVGPCSIHNEQEALEYARKLNDLRKKVEDKLVLVMRAYFEKPRTTVGWKGFLYDPDLDGEYDLQNGVRRARSILVKINEMGLPTATEVLGPITIQYYSDLICWSAIGARTAESQTHRELASGLSMPVGFKNGTGGSVKIAVDAAVAAKFAHKFLGMDERGVVSVVETKGNEFGHLILRGGKSGTNYGKEDIKQAALLCDEAEVCSRVIVDCSHANSGKDYRKQAEVWNTVWNEMSDGVAGLMLESNLFEGSQKVGEGKVGVSITDSCIGWEETEKLILEQAR